MSVYKLIEKADGYYYENDEEIVARIVKEKTEDPNVSRFTQVYVNPKYRGQGIAGRILDEVVTKYIKEDKKIEPVCSYVVDKFDKDSKYKLVDARKA